MSLAKKRSIEETEEPTLAKDREGVLDVPNSIIPSENSSDTHAEDTLLRTSSVIKLLMEPYEASVDLKRSALILIDFQCDFLQPGGFGDLLGNDVSKLQRAVAPMKEVLAMARALGVLVIHTREGHRPDMLDLHQHKKLRPGVTKPVIGTDGPTGKILIRGEPGHDTIPELYPLPGEPVIDKPGKGSFYATDLGLILKAQQIENLFVCGVTTEVCVHTTVREANDRGFHCIVVSDCCASFFDDFHETALRMIVAQHGIFGSLIDSHKLVAAMSALKRDS